MSWYVKLIASGRFPRPGHVIGASVSEPTLVFAMRVLSVSRRSMVDVVQVVHATGLPRRLAGARYRICTTPIVCVRSHDGYLTAATAGVMDTLQQRLQARCQHQ